MRWRFLSLATCSLLFSASMSARAATLAPGDLVKGPGDTVYYYAANAQRYVFPTAKTYFSWYIDFSNVKTIASDELAAIPLGGNVTYRPGVKLVKIATDPKVYAVSLGGVLRWVQSEALATALYGAEWNKKIDDIPDAFFVNYTVGSPIESAADYSPSAQTASASNISTDKKIAPTLVPSQATSTPSTTATTTTAASPLAFSSSKTIAQAGDVLTLTAMYQGSVSIAKIEIFFDGALVKTCTTISCAGDAVVPTSGTKSSYAAETRATLQTTEVISKSLDVQIKSDGKTLVQIRVGQSVVASGQAASAIAEADPSIAINRIEISVDGTFVKACATGARQCQWSDYLFGANSSTHPVSARVLDNLGRIYTSKIIFITIGINDLPGVTVTPALSTIYAGESVDVTTTATDADGIASIEVLQNGTLLKKCDGAQPCTARTGPWNSAGSVSFTGRATDARGNVGSSMDAGVVQVQTRS